MCQAHKLSRATQVQFARAMGIHRVTFARYLSGATQPSQLVACAAIFTAVCFGVRMRIQRPSLEVIEAKRNFCQPAAVFIYTLMQQLTLPHNHGLVIVTKIGNGGHVDD